MSKRFDPTVNFPLPGEDAVPAIPDHVFALVADRSPHREWTPAGCDDLRVGDVVRLRTMVPVSRGRGSHGQLVYDTMRGFNERKVVRLRPYLAVCEIDRIYAKRTKNAAVMVNLRVLWDDEGHEQHRAAHGYSQATVTAENAKPIGRRKVEVRRLRESGPTKEARRHVDALSHSLVARTAEFMALWTTVPTSGAIMLGNPWSEPRTRVSDEELGDWLQGVSEPPAWVFNILRRELGKVGAGDERPTPPVEAYDDLLAVDPVTPSAMDPVVVEEPPVGVEPEPGAPSVVDEIREDVPPPYGLDRDVVAYHPSFGQIRDGDFLEPVDEDEDDHGYLEAAE